MGYGAGNTAGNAADTEWGAPCDTERDRARDREWTGPAPAPPAVREQLPVRFSQSGRAFRKMPPSQPIRRRIREDAAISGNQKAVSEGCRLSQSERGGSRLQPPQPIRTRGVLLLVTPWLFPFPLPVPPSPPRRALTLLSLPSMSPAVSAFPG